VVVVILVEIHLKLPFEITGKNMPKMAGNQNADCTVCIYWCEQWLTTAETGSS